MGRGFNIPWKRGSQYHKWEAWYTIDKGLDILSVGVQNTMENGFNIPYHKRFHIKDQHYSRIQEIPPSILLQVLIHV
jgi:hypothetical protein